MATAALHIDNLGGFAGFARCYQIDPPKVFDDEPYDYVTIWIVPPWRHTQGRVVLVPATETGACATISVKDRVGTYTLDGDPTGDEAYIEGCFTMSLSLLGGYVVTTPLRFANAQKKKRGTP